MRWGGGWAPESSVFYKTQTTFIEYIGSNTLKGKKILIYYLPVFKGRQDIVGASFGI